MSDELPRMPARDPKGHKGTFGTVAVVGGCCAGATRMIGAPALSGLAALRSGAGLVKLLIPAPIINEAISLAPSATGIALEVDEHGRVLPSEAAAALDRILDSAGAIAIGPGLGRSPDAGTGPEAMVLRVVQQERAPVIVDADAIIALGAIAELHRDFRAPVVLTPHPGEFRAIAAALKVSGDPVDPAQRPAAAEQLAQRLGCVVVLKGAGTVVTDGIRTWVCDRGHACLGTAGTGDVLTGLIAGIAAQTVRILPFASRRGVPPGQLDLYDAARLGVLAHAIAGERWASSHKAEAGLVATELADLLPEVLAELSGPAPRL